MGRNKLLIEVGGESLVRRAVQLAGAAGLDPVVVVTGQFRDEVEREIGDDLACATVFNPDHETGIHTSVARGVAAVAGGEGAGAEGEGTCAAAVVLLPDMPFVTSRMVGMLLDRYRETGAPVVASRYGGEVHAPPVLYDQSLFGEIARMMSGCGREVVRRHRDRATFVDWPADRLRDLDRPDDFASAQRELVDA